MYYCTAPWSNYPDITCHGTAVWEVLWRQGERTKSAYACVQYLDLHLRKTVASRATVACHHALLVCTAGAEGPLPRMQDAPASACLLSHPNSPKDQS